MWFDFFYFVVICLIEYSLVWISKFSVNQNQRVLMLELGALTWVAHNSIFYYNKINYDSRWDKMTCLHLLVPWYQFPSRYNIRVYNIKCKVLKFYGIWIKAILFMKLMPFQSTPTNNFHNALDFYRKRTCFLIDTCESVVQYSSMANTWEVRIFTSCRNAL